MARKKGKKLKLLKGEKMMVFFVIPLLFVVIQLLHVYTSSIIAQTNIEVEKLKDSIDIKKEENESLNMQIDELASLENIQEVADEYGLSYHNTNILKIK